MSSRAVSVRAGRPFRDEYARVSSQAVSARSLEAVLCERCETMFCPDEEVGAAVSSADDVLSDEKWSAAVSGADDVPSGEEVVPVGDANGILGRVLKSQSLPSSEGSDLAK